VILRDIGRLPECIGNLLRVARRVFGPVRRAVRGIDADDAVLADPQIVQLAADPAGFPDLREERRAIGFVAHRRSTARRRPHRRHQGTHAEVLRCQPVRQRLQLVVRGIDIGMRQRKKQIDSVETRAVHFGGRREIDHRVQVDWRFRIGAFAYQAGPHRVM